MTIATPVNRSEAYVEAYRAGALARQRGHSLDAGPTGTNPSGLPNDTQRGWRAGWMNEDEEIRQTVDDFCAEPAPTPSRLAALLRSLDDLPTRAEKEPTPRGRIALRMRDGCAWAKNGAAAGAGRFLAATFLADHRADGEPLAYVDFAEAFRVPLSALAAFVAAANAARLDIIEWE